MLAGEKAQSGLREIGCLSNSSFKLFSSPTVDEPSCLLYSISSTDTLPVGLWSLSFPGIPRSLHAESSVWDLLNNAQNRVFKSTQRICGNSVSVLIRELASLKNDP